MQQQDDQLTVYNFTSLEKTLRNQYHELIECFIKMEGRLQDVKKDQDGDTDHVHQTDSLRDRIVSLNTRLNTVNKEMISMAGVMESHERRIDQKYSDSLVKIRVFTLLVLVIGIVIGFGSAAILSLNKLHPTI